MRFLVWLILLLVVAIVGAYWLGDNDGMVSFFWGGWRADVSINVFLLSLLLLGGLTLVLVNAIDNLLHMPERARRWRLTNRERAAQASLREALAEYFAARYARAQKAARKAISIVDDTPSLARDGETRSLAALLLAGSLHRLQDRLPRNAALETALEPGRKGAQRAVDEGARLLGAEWAIEDRDAERAQALLADLGPGARRRSQAQRLQLQIARMARRPLDALRIARLLANHHAFSPAAAQILLRSLAVQAIDDARDADQLRRTWRTLDASDQRDPFVASNAARRAAEFGARDDARAWLRPYWDRIADFDGDERDPIALASIDAFPGLGPDWLPRLEAAQRVYPTDPAIQAAVGIALADRRLYGKARPALELASSHPALDASARRKTWRTLAAMAREDEDDERAAACDRAAAEID